MYVRRRHSRNLKHKNMHYLPLSNALEVPFKTSRVSAATTSACLAIIPALSTASAPIDVIS